MSATHRCIACHGNRARIFLEIQDMPVLCNVLHSSPTAAREAARGNLHLAVCPDCGHVFNTAYDPARLEYAGDYENSLHHSPRFQSYADALAAELTGSYLAGGGQVVEIACGQGDFLRQLVAVSGARGIGYDPSYRRDQDPHAGTPGVEILAQPFDADVLATQDVDTPPPDLILCRQALEHFGDPQGFLAGIGAALKVGLDHQIVFEVPNALYSLCEGGIWDFIYEHVSFFTPPSLAACFERAGFAVGQVQPRFGGQFLSLAGAWPRSATPIDADHADQTATPSIADIVTAAMDLAGDVTKRCEEWRGRLADAAGRGDTIAVWGAGSKGVTFLNLMQAAPDTAVLVDINPRKQGMFAAGTGVPIVAPEGLKASPPTTVVVMNPLYLEEIRGTLATMGLTPDVVAM